MSIWSRNTATITTGASRWMRRRRRTIICRCQERGSCARSSGWRRSARWVTKRLGGAARESFLSSGSPEPEPRPGQEQGDGVRVGGRDQGDPLPRAEAELARDRGTSGPAGGGREETSQAGHAGGGASAESPLAEELPGHAGSGIDGRRRVAVLRGVRLRSALNARLRLAGLRYGRSHAKPYGETNIQKGTLLLHQDRRHF